ncbi:hypothetical protein ASG41_10985 [Modestobacter sp. Leaf380]|nr:hypothetical protein ASG41_10985 [Modestobacter sp. Leaf380]
MADGSVGRSPVDTGARTGSSATVSAGWWGSGDPPGWVARAPGLPWPAGHPGRHPDSHPDRQTPPAGPRDRAGPRAPA